MSAAADRAGDAVRSDLPDDGYLPRSYLKDTLTLAR